MESTGSSTSKKTDDVGFDPESPWCGRGRSEPWWRVADKAELASWVSQRSFDFIDNCDLPRPQIRSIKKDPRYFFVNYDRAAKAQESDCSIPKVDIDGTSALGSGCRLASCEEIGLDGSDKQSSDNTIYKILTEQIGNDPIKVQLLEALRHSQTHAREAEKAANQANAEKEHIIELFFKQTSHLFAYKQWFKLLQLEYIYSHIKNSNQPLSSLFPLHLPFNPNQNRKLPKKEKKPEKAKKPAREPE